MQTNLLQIKMSQIKLDEMCRICGDIATTRSETFQEHGEYIYKYLPIKNNDKELPKIVCLNCLSSITNWDTFYNRCKETQTKFALLLRENTEVKASEDNVSVSIGEKKEITKNLCSSKRNAKSAKRNMLPCYFCNVKSTSQEALNVHLITAHCNLIFCCDMCNCYMPREELIPHMKGHAFSAIKPPTSSKNTSKSFEKFQCPECTKKFISTTGLKQHMNSRHMAAKQFPCEECGNIFTCRRVLLNHVRSMHRKEKHYECTICKKSFKTDSTLYAHRKTHLNKTEHKCLYCDKGFNFKHHLNIHLLQHDVTDKTFECSNCQKKFAALNNLTKHRKIHDNTVDFTCHICGVKTLQKRYLRDHIKRVHQKWLNGIESAK